MALFVSEAGTLVPAGRRAVDASRCARRHRGRRACGRRAASRRRRAQARRHHQHAFLLVPAAQLAPPRHEHRPGHELLGDLQSAHRVQPRDRGPFRPAGRPGHELGAQQGWQGLYLPPQSKGQVARRQAGHRRGCGLLHGQHGGRGRQAASRGNTAGPEPLLREGHRAGR